MIIKIEANPYKERLAIIEALSSLGYKTWVEEEEREFCIPSHSFHICFEKSHEAQLLEVSE